MNDENKNLLLPVVVIILAVASYIVCSNLLFPSIFENTSRIKALDTDISNANQKLDSLSAADKSMTALATTVNGLLIAVPDSINSPDLITEIETIANQNQVALPSLTPPTSLSVGGASASTPTSTGGLSTSLTVTGTYQNINGFINALETSIRFSKINSLTISANDTALTASINLEVYSRPAAAAIAAPSSTEPATTSNGATP